MGLIYSSSDSENLINGLRANIGSAKVALEDLVSASQTLTNSIGEGKALDGSAFNAGKDLFSALIIPTIHRASSVFDDTKKHLSQYESANGQVSGEGVLDEDKLKAKKFSTEAIKAATDSTASTLRAMASAAEAASSFSVASSLNEAAQSLENYSEILQQDLNKIEDKLRKLYKFNSAVNGLFNDDLNNFKLVMQSVTVLNETVVDSKTGSYTLPNGIDKSWFTSIKSAKDYEYLALVQLLSLEGTVEDKLGLTKDQKDWYERIKMLMKNNPAKVYEELCKCDVLWSTLRAIFKKYPEERGRVLDIMIVLSNVSDTKAAKLFKDGVELFEKVTSPVKTVLKAVGLEDALKASKALNLLGKGADLVKFFGKDGTVPIFAELGLSDICSSITDGIKEKSIGKGIIGGTIDTLKSIGPLDGTLVGASIGSCILPGPGTVIGAVVGAGLGFLNRGVQTVFPKAYDNIKDGAYKLYDDGMKELNTMKKAAGQQLNTMKKAAGQQLNTIKKAASDFIKDPVKSCSKFIPNIGFGW
ncbi:hypothetical protein ACJDT4_20685 [Clostridium neuense]|uniref:LXG domain-containing protein n=1 Tax=Clostridium neuense TaxID=1728934 RepID=A0ABW8TJV2_9CLOT